MVLKKEIIGVSIENESYIYVYMSYDKSNSLCLCTGIDGIK